MSSTARRPAPADPTLAEAMAAMGWIGAAKQLGDLVQHAVNKRLSHAQFLESILDTERNERAARSLDRRQRRARIGAFKPMADFDWGWPAQIDRPLAERALALRFFDAHENVIICGGHGLGKTMMLKNIAASAIRAGHSVILTTAQRMLGELAAIDSPSHLKKVLGAYAGIALLAIDELGYLTYNERAADLLFDVVSRRYEAGRPIVISTNLAFSNWGQVFPNAICTKAIIERLVHRADIINVLGESWRMKEASERREADNREPAGARET